MTHPLVVEIAVEAGAWPEALHALAERALLAAAAGSGRPLAGPAEVSVLLTDDAAQAALNRQWRGKEGSTNVLSFPQLEAGEPFGGLLGDLSLAFETLEREAKGLEKPFEEHFSHLLVHGFLHLCGLDHETRQEALAMEGRETDIMAALGYPDPYRGEEPQ